MSCFSNIRCTAGCFEIKVPPLQYQLQLKSTKAIQIQNQLVFNLILHGEEDFCLSCFFSGYSLQPVLKM